MPLVIFRGIKGNSEEFVRKEVLIHMFRTLVMAITTPTSVTTKGDSIGISISEQEISNVMQLRDNENIQVNEALNYNTVAITKYVTQKL